MLTFFSVDLHDQAFVNDFNAVVPIGTSVSRGFFTTWRYASARLIIANESTAAERFVFSEVDDFAAALHVLCEHAGVELPSHELHGNRTLFALSPLEAAAADSFHRFLQDFHAVLMPTAIATQVAPAELLKVKEWVNKQLLRSPLEAYHQYADQTGSSSSGTSSLNQ